MTDPERESPWTVSSERATFGWRGLSGVLDLQQVEVGLQELVVSGGGPRAIWPEIELFAVQLPQHSTQFTQPTLEAYTRQGDLVTTLESEPFRLQRYYRLGNPEAWPELDIQQCWGVDFLLSLQTGLLHSNPQTQVIHRLPQGELWWFAQTGPGETGQPEARHCETGQLEGQWQPISSSGEALPLTPQQAGCLLLRPSEVDWLSVVLCLHPADGNSVEVRSAEQTTIRYQVFGSFLEKGVILKARMRAAFLARQINKDESFHDIHTALDVYQTMLSLPLPLTT